MMRSEIEAERLYRQSINEHSIARILTMSAGIMGLMVFFIVLAS